MYTKQKQTKKYSQKEQIQTKIVLSDKILKTNQNKYKKNYFMHKQLNF